jgi:outer membrane protein assembly factor BamA
MRSFFICIPIIILFIAVTMAYAIELDEFSENKQIYISDIIISGNNIMSEKEIFDISGFDREKGLYIREIRGGITKLKECGYFSSVTFSIAQGEKGYQLAVSIRENPPLASLKVIENKMLDLSIFKKKLRENNVTTDMVFSPAKLEQAIVDFNIYNQNYGMFLYVISYKIVTRDEIFSEGGRFLYEPAELQKTGLHVIVYVRDIPRLVLGEIRMKNVTVSYDDILNYLNLKQGMPVESDEDLYSRYKRLKKLGFFESVYFKLIPQDDAVYKLDIETKEISLSELTTSVTAPANIGIIMSAEYYNIAVIDTMQRFRIGVGWEVFLRSPVATVEYTHPYFLQGLFVDTTFSKNDFVDTIKDESNKKLSNAYEGKFTMGKNFWGDMHSYLYHKETYTITNIVDKDYDKIARYKKTTSLTHASGIMVMYDNLDDNFFVTQGLKMVGDYEAYWKKPMAYKAQVSGEVYLPIPMFNLIAAASHRSNFLFAEKKDKTVTLSLDNRMRTNVQEIQNIGEQRIKFTTYTSAELRFPLPQDVEMFRGLSFILFGEAGGAWSEYNAVSLKQTQFGFGIGLRLSPRKHYSSFLFQFPAGLYIGYRVGDNRPRPTLVSHRDQMYYINLTASF